MTLTITEKTLYLIVGLILIGLQIYQYTLIRSTKKDVEVLFRQMANMILSNIASKQQSQEKNQE